SRGRHTRFSRDWSSDVCSSDLSQAGLGLDAVLQDVAQAGRGDLVPGQLLLQAQVQPRHVDAALAGAVQVHRQVGLGRDLDMAARSEERRVAQESASAWWEES